MKSTIYQHHLRASASFSYRHLLHSIRGDPDPQRPQKLTGLVDTCVPKEAGCVGQTPSARNERARTVLPLALEGLHKMPIACAGR